VLALDRHPSRTVVQRTVESELDNLAQLVVLDSMCFAQALLGLDIVRRRVVQGVLVWSIDLLG
jgi:hypothetical protein